MDLQRYLDLSMIEREIRATNANIDTVIIADGYRNDIRKIKTTVERALVPLAKTTEVLHEVIDRLNAEIDGQCQTLFSANYTTQMEMNADLIREQTWRILRLPDDAMKILLGRIQHHVDWHYPGMELGPMDGRFTDQLVACDPLYIADFHHEFIASTFSKYNEVYQQRLRGYKLRNDLSRNVFSDLPQNQMGFIFSWEVFNFLALETVGEYLTGLYNVLRPGGTLLFSFNDGDTFNGARNAEWGGSTFVPKRLLVPLCEKIGYEIYDSYNFQNDTQDISWLEIKKPGMKSTVKAHQVLGMVEKLDQTA